MIVDINQATFVWLKGGRYPIERGSLAVGKWEFAMDTLAPGLWVSFQVEGSETQILAPLSDVEKIIVEPPPHNPSTTI